MDELTEEFVRACAKKLRESELPMKPLELEDGRKGYVLFQEKGELIDRALGVPGMTLRAVLVKGSDLVLWEMVRIQDMRQVSEYFRAVWPEYP